MTTVILHGAQGTGKNRFIELLAAAYGIETVIEEWMPFQGLTTGALHVTIADRYELSPAWVRLDDNLSPVHLYSVEMLTALFPSVTS